ncbi:dihydrofolate reductase family protein [Haloechinothrix sp. LS1_15]|uniref:dihydrofolate reductase family protein n=1 Tax=Haloechinothrix sp. LS1_15 TaxID=2652248 RepID=UPI00294B1923|nr:dihydrofolate reductase family protein [Haloechinothrix sp. LS1_15]
MRTCRSGGGASTIRQFLRAGLLDETQLHLTPVPLGTGVRLFDGLDPGTAPWRIDRVVESLSTSTTHLRYRVTA